LRKCHVSEEKNPQKTCTKLQTFNSSIQVHDNEKENWRILTNKEIYASVKEPTIIETIKLNRLCWFGHVQRMEENRIPERVYEFENNKIER
jgi:hypothetical protein